VTRRSVRAGFRADDVVFFGAGFFGAGCFEAVLGAVFLFGVAFAGVFGAALRVDLWDAG
jgi:hypothetical protein